MITISHCTYSNTIRQFPQNYLLARFDEQKKCWLMEPDLAANKNLVVALTLSLMEYKNKYSTNPVFAMVECSSHLEDDVELSYEDGKELT